VNELVTTSLVVDADPSLGNPIVIAARELERSGVSAITSDCGYLGLFQKEVAEAVNIPVFLTSWIQVPIIHKILQPGKSVGAIVADSRYIRQEILTNAGVNDSVPLIIYGMQDQPAFWAAVMREDGILDTDAVEREVVLVAQTMVSEFPDIGAILLECSCLPPYATAVQEAVRLPIFDFVTMINYIYSTIVRKRFSGTMY
jgi:hypothetical protein